MGFHCGNTCSKKLSKCSMEYQMIMARALPEECERILCRVRQALRLVVTNLAHINADILEYFKGYREYVAIAGKCWPAFQTQFGFVPCYVNSRLTGRGIPVSCEVDIYGALSEFIGTAVSDDPARSSLRSPRPSCTAA